MAKSSDGAVTYRWVGGMLAGLLLFGCGISVNGFVDNVKTKNREQDNRLELHAASLQALSEDAARQDERWRAVQKTLDKVAAKLDTLLERQNQ